VVRKRFLTPADIPAEDICRGLTVPNSQDWLGVFSEALSQTIYAYNYEQVNDTDLTPEAAAAEAYTRYVAWLDATCGSGGICELPGGGRVYRISPGTGHYEYLEDGAWVEDTEIPPIPARGEPTEPDRLCAAAANAVEVLRLTWTQALADFDASVAAQDALVDTVDGIAAIIGAVFYPPILAIFAMTQVGWEIVYTAYGLFTAVDWDDQLTGLLTCIFLGNATDTSGAITFDLGGVLADVWDLSLRGGVYITMAAQLQWIIGSIGPDGMSTAGSLDLVSGDCEDCAGWCHTFDFANGPQGWIAVRETSTINSAPGVWTGGSWVQTVSTDAAGGFSHKIMIGIQFATTHLTRCTVNYARTNGQIVAQHLANRFWTNRWDVGSPAGAAFRSDNTPGASGTGLTLDNTLDLEGVSSVMITLSASNRAGAIPNPVGTISIQSITLRGEGENPFGADNCA